MKKIFTLLIIFLSSFYSFSQCNSLYDGFETGTLATNWQFGTGTYTRAVTGTNPGVGNFSFQQNGSSSFYEGTYSLFPSGQPSYISFRMRTDNTSVANGYVVIGDANINSDNGILFCYFNGSSQLRFYGSTGQNFPINVNQWYHVEIQNINWTARTMDIYLDGNLILTSWSFRSTTANTMDRIHLFNLIAATTMYDEIIIENVPLTGSVTNTICNDDSVVVNGTTYNASNPTGTEVFTNIGPNGCDSTVAVSLNVLPAIDVTTTVNGNTITANQTGASYKWIDCNGMNYTGALAQSFTTTVTGNYAVEITLGNCIDTSACENVTVVGVDEKNAKNNIKLFPNPNNGVFTISTSDQANVSIYNVLGENVLTKVLNGGNHTISLDNQPKGMYFVNIQQNGSVITHKMIVK